MTAETDIRPSTVVLHPVVGFSIPKGKTSLDRYMAKCRVHILTQKAKALVEAGRVHACHITETASHIHVTIQS